MADKSNQLVLEALSRAAAEPAGVPLHGSKAAPGLFAATAAGKQAAQRCKDDGYVRVVGTATRGKTTQEVCAITDKGLAYLLGQSSPRQVLEGLVHALEGRQAQVDELLAVARQTQSSLDVLKATAEKVLETVGTGPWAVGGKNGEAHTNGHPKAAVAASPPADEAATAVLSYLIQWQSAGASEDCPLPELYRQVQKLVPALSVGHFHDVLRRLHDQGQIYLHPWTGPLYDLPEPPFALLVGHDIAYYASRR